MNELRTYGGPEASLRAYRHWHPDARIHLVTHRGRSVWMSDRQYDIWGYVKDYHRRNRRLTLAMIAAYARCSRATVSRFLRRLDLWRFIDLATLVGRFGGTWIKSRKTTTADREPWKAGASITFASRKRARDRMAARIREFEHAFRLRQIWRPEMRGYPEYPRPVVRVQHLTGKQFEIWEGRG